jgi:hypothetical protein
MSRPTAAPERGEQQRAPQKQRARVGRGVRVDVECSLEHTLLTARDLDTAIVQPRGVLTSPLGGADGAGVRLR